MAWDLLVFTLVLQSGEKRGFVFLCIPKYHYGLSVHHSIAYEDTKTFSKSEVKRVQELVATRIGAVRNEKNASRQRQMLLTVQI